MLQHKLRSKKYKKLAFASGSAHMFVDFQGKKWPTCFLNNQNIALQYLLKSHL